MTLCRVSHDLQSEDSPVNEQNEVSQDFNDFCDILDSFPSVLSVSCDFDHVEVSTVPENFAHIVSLVFKADGDCFVMIEGSANEYDFLKGYECFDLSDNHEDICTMVKSMIEFTYTYSYLNER